MSNTTQINNESLRDKQQAHSPQPAAGRPIRIHAIAIGVLLAGLICLLTPYNNIYLRATPLGGGHFPLAPFFIFFLLALLTALVAKIFRNFRLLSGGELVIIWIEMVIGSGIAYTGFARTFFINLTAPIQFATNGNHWKDSLVPLIPGGLLPDSAEAIEQLYHGLPGGREMGWMENLAAIPWAAWTTPLAGWGIFILMSYLAMLCIINILSRQWIHNERMNFPLLTVPRTISDAVNENRLFTLLSNRFLLAGLLLPLFLHGLNGLSQHYPSIPAVPTLILAGPYFSDSGVLSGLHKLKLYFYPAFIGFAFLTARQISFSFWLFFLAGALLYGVLHQLGVVVPASELGVTFGPTLSQPEELQMIGAYGVFFLFLVWLARDHLRDVVAQSFGIKPPARHRSEWFDVRISFWGGAILTMLLVYWYSRQGMAPLSAALLLASFFMIMIVATRIICQGGLAYFTLTAAPSDGLLALFGTKLFGGVSGMLTGMSQKVLFVDLRESLMPSLLHGRQLHHNRPSPLLLLSGLLLTIIVSLTASTLAMLTLCYRFGARELQLDWSISSTSTVYENIYRLVVVGDTTGERVIPFIVAGIMIMLVLVVCYHRFYWWPIHPIGYLTAYSSAMRILWLSFFIGWLCNVLCMRYGGITLFRKLQLFFIGLIIGDLLMGGIWGIVGLFTDISYQVLPD